MTIKRLLIMKSRTFTILLIMVMVFIFSVPVLAGTEVFKEDSVIISPMYTYISVAEALLYINSSGNAIVKTYVTGNSEVTRTTATINLQQHKSGRWTTIKTWNESSSSRILNFNSTHYVTRGYEYRVQSAVTTYSDTQSESATLTSSSQSY